MGISQNAMARAIGVAPRAINEIVHGKRSITPAMSIRFGVLHRVCTKPLKYHKAETLRKRLIPGAREHSEVFVFIRFDGPPTNNHTERALRPLVIFRKVCMGTRSEEGSRNIGIFTSLTQTAKLQQSSVLDLFPNLLTGTAEKAQNVLFSNSS